MNANNPLFAYTELKPVGRTLYQDPFTFFIVQVKSDSEYGALLNNDPVELLRRETDVIGDEKDVRAMVLRANAQIPANPHHTTLLGESGGNSKSVFGIQYKYPQDMTK